MADLYDLYVEAKEKVANAVIAIDETTIEVAKIVIEPIQEALAAIMEYEGYFDYFGWVGDPINTAVEEIVEKLFDLAVELDNRGFYAQYRQTFSTANLYADAKTTYDGFTGGWGGKSSGGGAKGDWNPPTYPFWDCWNSNNAKISSLTDPEPIIDVDMFIFLGPCSGAIIAAIEGDPAIYQYIARAVSLHFHRRVGCLVRLQEGMDNGETPGLPELPDDYTWNTWSDPIGFYPGYYENILDVSGEFRLAFKQEDWSLENKNPAGHPWPFIGAKTGWPFGYPYQAIPAETRNLGTPQQEIKYLREVKWQPLGKNAEGYWRYWLQWWTVERIINDTEVDMNFALPDVLSFDKICDTPEKGKDVKPWAPWLIPPIMDEKIRDKLLESLRVGLIWLPYELMCDGKKIICNGEQVTCGDPEGT